MEQILSVVLDSLKNTASLFLMYNIVLALIVKVLPKEKVYGFFYGIGKALTLWGTVKFGAIAWERAEVFFVETIGLVSSGFKAGLRSDNKD